MMDRADRIGLILHLLARRCLSDDRFQFRNGDQHVLAVPIFSSCLKSALPATGNPPELWFARPVTVFLEGGLRDAPNPRFLLRVIQRKASAVPTSLVAR